MKTSAFFNPENYVNWIIKKFDKRKNMDFLTAESNEACGTDEETSFYYSPSSGRILNKALKECHVTANDIFLDYGCGKGFALRIASRFPFKKIIGVELSKYLSDICKNNMRIAKIDAKIVNQDAVKYRLDGGGKLLIFL